MSYQLLSHRLGNEDQLVHSGAVPTGSSYGYSIVNDESGHQVDFYTNASGEITAVASNLSDLSNTVFSSDSDGIFSYSGSSITFFDGVNNHTFAYTDVDALDGRIAFDVTTTAVLKNTIPPITLGADDDGDGLPDSFTFTDYDDGGNPQDITIDLIPTGNPVTSPGVVATAEIIWDESDYNGNIFTVTEKLELISNGNSITSYTHDSTTNNYWGDGYYGSVEEGSFTINADGTATATPETNGGFASSYEPMDVYTLDGSEGVLVLASGGALSGTYAIDKDSNVATPVQSDGNSGWVFSSGAQIILDDTNDYSSLPTSVGTLNGSSTTITPTPSGLQVYDITETDTVLDADDAALSAGLYAIDTTTHNAYLVYWDVTDSTYYSVQGSEASIALSSSNDYGTLLLSNRDGDSTTDDIFYPPTTPITPIETLDPVYVQLKDVRLWEANGVTAASQAEAFSGFGSADGSEYLLAYPSISAMTPYPTGGTITLRLKYDDVHLFVDANTYALLTEAEMQAEQSINGYDVFVDESPFDIQVFGNVVRSLEFTDNNDGTWDTTQVKTVTPADTTLKVSDKDVILDLTKIDDTSITFFADVSDAQNIHLGNGDSYTVDQGYAGFALNADGVNGTDLINTYLQGTDFVVLDVSNFDPSDGEPALDLDVGAAAAGEQDVLQIDSDSQGIYYQSYSDGHDYLSTYYWTDTGYYYDDDIAIVRNAHDAAIFGTWHDDIFETFNDVEDGIGDQAATFFGGDGDDWLMGSTASDFLDGGDGSDDLIEGFEGDDLLVDWDGAEMSGGSGKDTFVVGDGYYGDESLPETYINDFDLTKQGLGRNPSSVQDQIVFAVSGATLASVLQGADLDLFKGMTFEGDGEVAATSATAYTDFNQLFDFEITSDEAGAQWSVQLMYGDVALGSVDLEVRSLNTETGEYENVAVTGTDLIQAYMVGTYDLAGMISNNLSELFMYETAGVADLNATWNEATLQKDGDAYLESDLFVQFAVGLEIQDAYTVFPSSLGSPKQTLMFVSDTEKGTTFVPLDANESLVGSMLGDTIRYINNTGRDVIFDRNVGWGDSDFDTVDFNEINVTFDDFLEGNVTAERTELYAEGESSLQISGVAAGTFGPADNQTNATVDVNVYRHFDESHIYSVEQLVLNDGSQTGQAWDLAGVNWDSEDTDNNHAILVGHDEGEVDAFNLHIKYSDAVDDTGAKVPADLTVFIDGFDQGDSVSIDGIDLTEIAAPEALDANGNGVWTYGFVDDNDLSATLTLYFSGTLGVSVPPEDLAPTPA
jgi:hypothetical protein